MDKFFRTEQGRIVDIISYTIEQMNKNPDVRIHIGTDSQVKGKDIHYVPCIVYRVGLRGAHYIYKRVVKDRPPKNTGKDEQIKLRLNDEVFMTMEIALFLIENTSVKVDSVEFDFNNEPEHISNKVIGMATGWAKGLGLNPKTKPEQLMACRASDHICRR